MTYTVASALLKNMSLLMSCLWEGRVQEPLPHMQSMHVCMHASFIHATNCVRYYSMCWRHKWIEHSPWPQTSALCTNFFFFLGKGPKDEEYIWVKYEEIESSEYWNCCHFASSDWCCKNSIPGFEEVEVISNLDWHGKLLVCSEVSFHNYGLRSEKL